jgi:two-component system sensor histidine kinase KdpD
VLLATGITALSTGVFYLLGINWSNAIIALLYLVPVIISATLGGLLAGIVASLLSFLAFNYLFIPPLYTFQVEHPQDFLVIVVLLGVAGLVSSLMARAQARLAQVQAREREAVQLYELSNALTGQRSLAGIAGALAERLASLFPAALVEVEIALPEGNARAQAPGGAGKSAGMTPERAALVSAGKRLGEIRLWGLKDRLSPAGQRLLQTFAGQGALALERASLAAGEERARVLEESDRLKTAILSSVSHELRTPLATIQASATSLFNRQVELEPQARAELEALLLEETEHLTLLVGNLLNMSRIEAGALKLQRQWNSLAEIADIALKRLKRRADRREIRVEISEDLPLVAVDPVLMEQVFLNLVGNSLKFAPPGTPVVVSAEETETALVVSVGNAGPPIPAPYLDRVFEKFAPIPGREANRGTGLGLSICQGIVEAHGGRIWAENLADGVAFRFRLPRDWQGVRPVLPGEEGEERA